MKQRDLMDLLDGLAPILHEAIRNANVALGKRLEATETRAKQLEAQLEDLKKLVDLESLRKLVPTAEEVAKLVEVKEVDLVATVDLCAKQVLENIPAAPTVEEIAKLVPAGKDADPELIKTQVKDAMALWGGEFKLALPEIVRDAIAEHVGLGGESVVDAIKHAAEVAVAALPKPKDGVDGTSVDKEELNVIVAEHVEDAMKTLPVPKDGKDATPEQIAEAVAKQVDEVVNELKGIRIKHENALDNIPSLVKERLQVLVDEAVATIPRIVQDGKDATPEQIAAAVEKVLATWPKPKDGESVTVEQLLPLIEKEIASQVAEIPAPKDGKDGVGLTGVLKDHEGCVVFTLTDGTMSKIGRVDGEDGLGFDDLEMIETDAHVTFRFVRGDRVKEFKYTKATIADFYKGVWAPGTHHRGSLVTWGGSLWLALKETTAKPDTKDSDDWKLVVKRGRDGKDFTPVK